jgi:hypothetical protein
MSFSAVVLKRANGPDLPPLRIKKTLVGRRLQSVVPISRGLNESLDFSRRAGAVHNGAPRRAGVCGQHLGVAFGAEVCKKKRR